MSDMIRFQCGACGKRLKAPPDYVGKRVKCDCGQSQVVPGGAAAGATSPPSVPPPLPPALPLANSPLAVAPAAAPRPMPPGAVTPPRGKKGLWLALAIAISVLAASGLTAGCLFWPASTPEMTVRDCYIESSYRVVNKDREQNHDFVVLLVALEDVPSRDESPRTSVIRSDGTEWKPFSTTVWEPGDEARKATKRIGLDLYFVIPKKIVESERLHLKCDELPPLALPFAPRSYSASPPTGYYEVQLEKEP